MTQAALLALAGHGDQRTIGHYLLSALPMAAVGGGMLFLFGLFIVRYTFWRVRKEARLVTHSSAFWVRWPPDRWASAPYAELAAEAARCAQLVVCAQDTLRAANKRPAFVSDHFERRLAEYEGMLAAVQQALARHPPQGWPTAQ